MSNIDKIIENVIKAEGGYVNDPDDRGGETMYGITVAVARANGYAGPMRNMPISVARKIYRDRYVVAPNFHKVAEIDGKIGEELVDTGVNMGPAVAATFLQRWLTGFCAPGAPYNPPFADGRVGPLTLDALEKFLKWRGADGRIALFRGLNGVQAARYLEITEARPTQRKFLFGWLLNRVE